MDASPEITAAEFEVPTTHLSVNVDVEEASSAAFDD